MILADQATSFSIESVGNVLSEFGLYTADSKAYPIVQDGLTQLLTAYIVAMVVAVVVWAMLRRSKTSAPVPRSVSGSIAKIFGAVIVPIIIGFVGYWIVKSENFTYQILVTFWVLLSIGTCVFLGVVHRILRRDGVSNGLNWAIIILGLAPVILMLSWAVILMAYLS